MEILYTIIILWLIQCLVCCIIHIINDTKNFPRTFIQLFTKFLNIIWVFKNLNSLRDSNGRQKPF